MIRFLDKFVELTTEFGNYTRKYLQQIAATLDELVRALEVAGLRDEVHFRQPAWDLEREMDVVLGVAPRPEARIPYLACYYGCQYLRLNAEAVNALKAGVVPGANRDEVFRKCLAVVGSRYSKLLTAFTRRVLDILTENEDIPPFALCGVGTLTDHDDVDVAVITADAASREAVDLAMSRFSTVMLRYATRLHFYLSEHLSPGHFATTLDEYAAYTRNRMGDFVVVSELLNAEFLYGDVGLFEALRAGVTSRYAGTAAEDRLLREGYIRGALGEVVSLTRSELEPDRLNPKDDALRIIKTLVNIKRNIHGLESTDPWRDLGRLAALEPWNADDYGVLASALTFFEILRYLYQLLVVQDEVITLDSPVMKTNLARVARVMGYAPRGVTAREDALLVHYYDGLDRVRAVADRLRREVEDYLRTTTVFLNLASGDAAPPGELLSDAFRSIRYLAGADFWDDVFDLLLASDRKLLRAVVADFERQPPPARDRYITQMVGILKRNAALFTAFLAVLGENRGEVGGDRLFADLNAAFLRQFGTHYNPAREAAHLFFQRPIWLHRYLNQISHDDAATFSGLIHGDVGAPALAEAADALRELCRLRYYGSAYLRRYLRALLGKYRDCLHSLHDPARLTEKSQGILAESALVETPREKKELLGDYYDLEFLRVALKTFAGAPVEETNADYAEFSNTYLKFLFDACREELVEKHGRWVTSFDVMAIYAAGGLARGWAFNDDYDLVVLIDSRDAKLRELGIEIIAGMSAEISKRGIMPHYRFAEYFTDYVIPIAELEAFFASRPEADFIEKSQVLESRLIVGTTAFEEQYHDRIIRPFIFDDADRYVADMRAEMTSRQAAVGEAIAATNLKECVGGLRDIVMTTLIYKARFGIRDPLTANILEAIARVFPEAGIELRSIYNSLCFLKSLRDIYRLTVCVDDDIDFEHADVVAEILGFDGDGPEERGRKMRASFERTTAKVAAEVRSLLARVP